MLPHFPSLFVCYLLRRDSFPGLGLKAGGGPWLPVSPSSIDVDGA